MIETQDDRPAAVTSDQQSTAADVVGGVDVVKAEEMVGVVTAEEAEGLKQGIRVDYAKEDTPARTDLSAADVGRIVHSPDFNEFFQKTTKLVERVLGEADVYDVMTDYSGAAHEDDISEEVEKMKKVDIYHDNGLCTNRPITDIRTSPKFNELFLASYGAADNMSITDPDGCVLVWSLPMTQRPEYTFTCQSAVCTAMFDKFTPNIIVGGIYTGSLVLWDTRAGRKPVQRTPLSSKSHSHPVYSLEIVGTQHAHNVISVCTDGRLCVWSLSMLVHPSESISLKRSNKELSVGCVAVAEGESNAVYGGAEDGSLFQAHVHGSRVGVTAIYSSHQGPITSTHFHPASDTSAVSFADLLLSSSMDWSINLWSPRSYQKPLWTFDASEDYVYDVKWHPNHPAVFASANGEGFIDLWNLNNDWESPVYRVETGGRAVNRLCWSEDGRRLMSGDGEGNLSVWAASHDVITTHNRDRTQRREGEGDHR
eukprot:GHVS01094097.1.p1 GENE.GHVS01094097.1~~GHVS01094097.1.p1  ORF type:complete len:481 (+),score=58.83 GHVS01094097.1:92-1534(+)